MVAIGWRPHRVLPCMEDGDAALSGLKGLRAQPRHIRTRIPDIEMESLAKYYGNVM